MRYRVTAPYVTATTAAGSWTGRLMVSGFHCGAILPGDVPAGQLEHLMSRGLVQPFEERAPDGR